MNPVAVSPSHGRSRQTLLTHVRARRRPSVSAEGRRKARVRMSAAKHPLLELAVSPATLKGYRAAVLEFIQWMCDNDEDADDEDEFDEVLLDYIQQLYDDGRGKSAAKDTMNGICLYLPQLRHMLPRSAQAIRGWNRLEVSRSHPPLTWELACVIAVHLHNNPLLLRHAVGVLLAFDCFLRVSELCNLRYEDVAEEDDLRLGSRSNSKGHGLGMVIAIRHAKTGRNQWVSVLNPQVVALLRSLRRQTKPKQRLFPFSASSFRRVFKQACAELGLSSRYVPHSLRHGGATRYKHLLNWSMEDIMVRGRWASSKSARIYIQAGVVMLMAMAASELSDVGERLAKHLLVIFKVSVDALGAVSPVATRGPALAAKKPGSKSNSTSKSTRR
jgi:integrase